MADPCVTIHECRVCGSRRLVPVADFGVQPLANALPAEAAGPEAAFPLRIAFCEECTLVQLMETIDKEILFTDYVWVSGTSPSTREYAETFFRRAVAATGVGVDDLVVEIASNDGTFLRPFLSGGYRNVVGVDPARNIAEEANRNGIPTIADFWDERCAGSVVAVRGKARLIYARNVLPHVSDLHGVVRGIAAAIDPEGCGIIEFHYAGDILRDLQYDSVYHEHLCYFSLGSIGTLLRRYGLHPFHVERSPISGGSFVLYFTAGKREETGALRSALAEEAARKVGSLDAWKAFGEECFRHRDSLREMVAASEVRPVVAFGASARSSTLLNFAGLGPSEIEAVIDNNPLKQGRLTPGTHLPIVTMGEGLGRKPGLVVILAWNFRGEIAGQCRALEYGGNFLVPFPNAPRIVEG